MMFENETFENKNMSYKLNSQNIMISLTKTNEY